MGEFFNSLDDWITHPWRNDIPLGMLFLFGVVFVVVCVWATDGIQLLKRATATVTEAVP